MARQKQQRIAKEVLQARFAARLRTTPRHQRAAEHGKVVKKALADAQRRAITWPEDTYWQGSLDYWRGVNDTLPRQVENADFWAESAAFWAQEDTALAK